MDKMEVLTRLRQTTSPREKRNIITKAAADAPITIAQYEQVLRKHRGHTAKAAKELNIPRTVLRRKIDQSPHLEYVMRDILEEALDDTEEKLQDLIEQGNVTAVTFKLRMQGRDRGYSEKSTLEHDISPKVRNAASLVKSMREGIKQIESTSDEEMEAVELQDYEWIPEEDTVEN